MSFLKELEGRLLMQKAIVDAQICAQNKETFNADDKKTPPLKKIPPPPPPRKSSARPEGFDDILFQIKQLLATLQDI